MKRWIPYPLMTAGLLAMWLLLNQSLSLGHFVLGTMVALVASWAMKFLRPEKVRVKFTRAIPRLAVIVLTDVLRSNLAVGRILLSRRIQATSGFISVPLDLRNKYGLALLAIIVTATPGTLWMEHDQTRNVLLVHVLDLVDKEHWIKLIKGRYERLLIEIFE